MSCPGYYGDPVMSNQGVPVPFPHHLVHQSPESRLDYFKAYTVAHLALKLADQAVWNALREPAGASLIFVFGPTGVGKTTLLAHIEKRLTDMLLAQGERERGHIPVLRLDAVSPALNQFKWGDYYQRALLLLQEPFVEYTIDYRKQVPLLHRTTVEREPLPRMRYTGLAYILVYVNRRKVKVPVIHMSFNWQGSAFDGK